MVAPIVLPAKPPKSTSPLTPSRATQWPTHGGGGAPRTCGWAHSALTALGAPPAAAIAALATAAAAAPSPASAVGASCEASLSVSVKSSDEILHDYLQRIDQLDLSKIISEFNLYDK